MKLSFLTSYKTNILAKWKNISIRERRYLTILGIVLMIMAIYYLLITPVNNAIINLQQAINYQQDIVENIKPDVRTIQRLQQSTQQANQVSSSNLLAIVDNNLKKNNLSTYATEISQTTNNGVQITLDNIPFDKMTAWLLTLWQQYHIQVEQIDIQKTKTLGNVNGLLTLQSS